MSKLTTDEILSLHAKARAKVACWRYSPTERELNLAKTFDSPVTADEVVRLCDMALENNRRLSTTPYTPVAPTSELQARLDAAEKLVHDEIMPRYAELFEAAGLGDPNQSVLVAQIDAVFPSPTPAQPAAGEERT